MKSFTFVYTKPEALPESQPLRVYTVDQATGAETEGSVAVTMHASADWLSVLPPTGNTVVNATVQLTDAAKNLAAGNYEAEVEVNAPALRVQNSPQMASVSLEVIGEAIEPPLEQQASLVVVPNSLVFTYKKPGNVPGQQSLRIVSSPDISATVGIYCDTDWLDLAPDQGAVPLMLNVKVNNAAKKMDLGVYHAQIEVRSTSTEILNSPQTATVTLRVVNK